jgi:hypothetical protein
MEQRDELQLLDCLYGNAVPNGQQQHGKQRRQKRRKGY